MSERTAIATTAAPEAIGPYSQAITHRGVLYCSGALPLDPETGELSGGSAAEQIEFCLRNLDAVCGAAGTSLADALMVTIYTTQLEEFAAINEAYRSFFGELPPARAALGVAALPKGAAVEVAAIVAT